MLQSKVRNVTKLKTEQSLGNPPCVGWSLLLLKYSENGELETGNCSYSPVLCKADKDGDVFTNVGDPRASFPRTRAGSAKGC